MKTRFIQTKSAFFYQGDPETRYVPVGCNYFDPHSGWAPQIWSKFEIDQINSNFAKIADAGFNTIRIFLDISTLNPEKGVFSKEGFEKVVKMTDAAEKSGLKIIYSGPNTWEGYPENRKGKDPYTDSEAMEQICLLWKELVRHFGDNPTIMAWDLINEPSVGWFTNKNLDKKASRLNAWQKFIEHDEKVTMRDSFPQMEPDTDLYTWNRYIEFLESLADNWVKQQCDAIRSAGAKQLITIGLIQWSVPVYLCPGIGYSGFDPSRIAKYLDYMSIHFYPMLQNENDNLDLEFDTQANYLKKVVEGTFIPGKPLVIEEFGWKGGDRTSVDKKQFPEEHQTRWGKHLVESTKHIAAGWLNWGYADSASDKADISKATGLWTIDYKINIGEKFLRS